MPSWTKVSMARRGRGSPGYGEKVTIAARLPLSPQLSELLRALSRSSGLTVLMESMWDIVGTYQKHEEGWDIPSSLSASIRGSDRNGFGFVINEFFYGFAIQFISIGLLDSSQNI